MNDILATFMVLGAVAVGVTIAVLAVHMVKRKPKTEKHIADQSHSHSASQIGVDISTTLSKGKTNIGQRSLSSLAGVSAGSFAASSSGQLYVSSGSGTWIPMSGGGGPVSSFTTTTSFPMITSSGWSITPENSTMGLPERDDDEPIGAFKCASLYFRPGVGLGLASLNNGIPHERLAEAECSYGRHDVIPALDCGCGFYALKDRDAARATFSYTNAALLEVELSGRVLVCDDGYRAQWQRILHVEIPGGCFYCGAQPDRLALNSDDALTARCAEHVRPFDITYDPIVIGLPITFALDADRVFNGPSHRRGS